MPLPPGKGPGVSCGKEENLNYATPCEQRKVPCEKTAYRGVIPVKNTMQAFMHILMYAHAESLQDRYSVALNLKRYLYEKYIYDHDRIYS